MIRRTAFVLAAAMLFAFAGVPAARGQDAPPQDAPSPRPVLSPLQSGSLPVLQQAARRVPAEEPALGAEDHRTRQTIRRAMLRRAMLRERLPHPVEAPPISAGGHRAYRYDANAGAANGSRTWLYVGSAAVALGIAAAVLLLRGGGSGGSETGGGINIPSPPARP